MKVLTQLIQSRKIIYNHITTPNPSLKEEGRLDLESRSSHFPPFDVTQGALRDSNGQGGDRGGLPLSDRIYMKLLLCSNNQGKVDEVAYALGGIEVVSLKQAGIDLDTVEDQPTIEGNALKKAREGCAASGLPSIADDTGLFIDALDGEPGHHVRRWPGHVAEDEELIDFTLNKMMGIPKESRTASFVTAIAYCDPDGKEFTVNGSVNDRILEARTGEYKSGLPFDTIFFSDELGASFSDAYDRKKEVSHRARAVKAFVEKYNQSN